MSSNNKEIYLRTSGILPIQKLQLMADAGIIDAVEGYPIQEDQFQPNSIDLRLGEKAYRVRCSFLPEGETVEDKLSRLNQYQISLKDGAILEPNCVYIIPLLEQLHLPSHISPQQTLFSKSKEDASYRLVSGDHISAKTNPKSTTGRLDVFTRVITDYSHRFEEIRSGYKGKLYLEVVPKSFPIRIQTGQRLNQLRLRHGFTTLTDQDILRTHTTNPLLFKESGEPLAIDDLKVNQGLFMSVNLHGEEGQIVGYKAKKHRDFIDLNKINHYNIPDYWEPIYAQQDDYIILEPEAFYIFASKERCRIPEHLAAEMVAYDTGSGELRTHYAGFFDSGFGGRIKDQGARAVLEVRSHDVPFLIEDGQTFCSMKFEPNTAVPEITYGDDIQSNYQGQDLKLGKHFKQNS